MPARCTHCFRVARQTGSGRGAIQLPPTPHRTHRISHSEGGSGGKSAEKDEDMARGGVQLAHGYLHGSATNSSNHARRARRQRKTTMHACMHARCACLLAACTAF
eukprot:12373037-Alexandrium_andersonii.AAC.1